MSFGLLRFGRCVLLLNFKGSGVYRWVFHENRWNGENQIAGAKSELHPYVSTLIDLRYLDICVLCIYIYIHTHLFIYIYIYIYMFLNMCIVICMYKYIYI